MQAPAQSFPQIGEWYSYDDLFDVYVGYWVLLLYPNPLTDEESRDIMGTRGKLIAFDKDHDAVSKAYRAFRQRDKETLLSYFATEQEEDIIVMAGGVMHATATNSVGTNGMAYAGQPHTHWFDDHFGTALQRCRVLLGRYWRGLFRP